MFCCGSVGFSRVFFLIPNPPNPRKPSNQLATWGHGGVDGARLDVSAAGIQQSFVALDLEQLRSRKLDARQIGKTEMLRRHPHFWPSILPNVSTQPSCCALPPNFPLSLSYLELRSFVWENMGSRGRISVGAMAGKYEKYEVKIFRAFF